MPSSTHEQLQKLRLVHLKLSQISQKSIQKIQTQKSIYLQFVKIFSKFSTKITQLSKKINEQILSPSLNNYFEESVIHHFQFLSNSLLKLGDCTKKIATTQRQEVIDPMKIFLGNYKMVSQELLEKIISNIFKLNEANLQLTKHKQNYFSTCEKFEKHRQLQNKTISKIQSGDKIELEKLNLQIKKLTNSITSTEQTYKQSVNHINQQWKSAKKAVSETMTSFSNNEETRISFAKRSVVNTLKMLESLQKGYISDAETKLKETSKVQQQHKPNHFDSKTLNTIEQIKGVQQLQFFLSFDQNNRKKKRIDAIEQQHLQQVFKLVKNNDKYKIKQFVESWFTENQQGKDHELQKQQSKQDSNSSLNSSINNQLENSPTSKKKVSIVSGKSLKSNKHIQQEQQHLDDVKGKVIESLPYSFYFIEELFNHINAMAAFYCKLNDEGFYYLLNTFNVTTKSIEFQKQTENQLNFEFIYKMMYISQRIFWKRGHQNKDRTIQLLCHHYSQSNKKFFNNKQGLEQVYNYLIRKKSEHKKAVEINKNTLSNFTKGLFSRKKQKIQLSADQQFNCLQQITNLMANFKVQNQVSLTLIKDLIANSGHSNQNSTFNYLKGLILAKKDIEERRKIYFKTEVKQKRQKRMKQVIENKQIAEFCIKLTAKAGFFSKDELSLRRLSKYLKTIHCQILSHLDIATTQKWVHLVPYKKETNYIKMKQQVAQKSVPSATQQIITLDVNRSLHIHGQYLNPTILHTLLRTYAFYHQDISYCQGMNYIAGYLYLKTLNEESSYRIFEHLMDLRFKELFADQFEVLKIKMYQFQRLLAIFHPQISQHFKRQAVSPQCYIVSWIITLFASSYQYTMQSYLIDRLWEKFIIYGWKQFFKFVLWMFDLKKEQLIELTYDKALHNLGQIAKSKFLLSTNKQYAQHFSHIQNIDDGMNRYEVTEQMLESIVSEYKLLK